MSKLGPRAPVDAVAEEITLDVTGELAESLGGMEEELLRALGQALQPGVRSLVAFDAGDRRGRPGPQPHGERLR